MSRVLLLVLLQAALRSESLVAASEDSIGLKFVVAFPENIAYYHPDNPENKIKVTAIHPNTQVEVKSGSSMVTGWTLAAGQTEEYSVTAGMELKPVELSGKSFEISSDKDITVHTVNVKKKSMQTALVLPTDRLGTEYVIPPVPSIEGTTHPADLVTKLVTERSPFKLVIINTDQNNQVSVGGELPRQFDLVPFQVAQVWLTQEEALNSVKAEQPVAVLFGHTCAIRENCTCAQLYATLPPANSEELTYYIPPILANGDEDKTFVLLSKQGSPVIQPFSVDSPVVMTTGTAILYSPGLLLTLIPETDFGSCSVINTVPNADNSAVIVVHEDFKDGVRIGNEPLADPKWQTLQSPYVYTSVTLTASKNVIWHTSSTMAVYFVGEKDGGRFGNPAPIVSKNPDTKGCVSSPDIVKIGETPMSWQGSVKYCRDNNLELVSLPTTELQSRIYEKITEANNVSAKDVWIGMRQSSLTGQWYWLNDENVTNTNWPEGKPITVYDGLCASLSLEKGKDYIWSEESCCKKVHPVCYKSPIYLPTQ